MQVWISPDGGLASDYVYAVQGLTANPEAVIVALLAIFAVFHSGLAYLRPQGRCCLRPGHGELPGRLMHCPPQDCAPCWTTLSMRAQYAAIEHLQDHEYASVGLVQRRKSLGRGHSG
jgi:hypothetical protein